MVLRGHSERFLSILVQVLYERQVTSNSDAYLMFDSIQHFNVQQLKLKVLESNCNDNGTFDELVPKYHNTL